MKTWQLLMENAYSHKYENMQDLFNKCTEIEKIAVTLGNLNYQVENGGFQQWIDNGYASIHGKKIVTYLKNIAKSENCTVANELANKISPLINLIDDNNEDDEVYEYAQSLDNWYYSIQLKLLPIIETYLSFAIHT